MLLQTVKQRQSGMPHLCIVQGELMYLTETVDRRARLDGRLFFAEDVWGRYTDPDKTLDQPGLRFRYILAGQGQRPLSIHQTLYSVGEFVRQHEAEGFAVSLLILDNTTREDCKPIEYAITNSPRFKIVDIYDLDKKVGYTVLDTRSETDQSPKKLAMLVPKDKRLKSEGVDCSDPPFCRYDFVTKSATNSTYRFAVHDQETETYLSLHNTLDSVVRHCEKHRAEGYSTIAIKTADNKILSLTEPGSGE